MSTTTQVSSKSRSQYKAKAYSAASAESPLTPTTIPRRDPGERDVQIEIFFCGICRRTIPQVYYIDIGKKSGSFNFHYNAYTIPDRFVISYEDTVFFDECLGVNSPGPYGGVDHDDLTLDLPFTGSTTVIKLEVFPNCLYQGDTEWNFTIDGCGQP